MKRFRFDFSEDLAELMFRTGQLWYIAREGYSDDPNFNGFLQMFPPDLQYPERRLFVTEFLVTTGPEPWETYTDTIVEIVMTQDYCWVDMEVAKR